MSKERMEAEQRVRDFLTARSSFRQQDPKTVFSIFSGELYELLVDDLVLLAQQPAKPSCAPAMETYTVNAGGSGEFIAYDWKDTVIKSGMKLYLATPNFAALQAENAALRVQVVESAMTEYFNKNLTVEVADLKQQVETLKKYIDALRAENGLERL
jgi:hypothetical protein